ncbi:MAG: SWIM zinc finger family protein [Candidatus Baltobacteraceae bacterium]
MSFDDRFWPESRPRNAKGGIKARSQRGAFGAQWWAKRWVAVLESLDMGSRLQRGRRYARAGQVLDVTIAAGLVTARVQGSRAKPYRVSIRVATLSKQTWKKIVESLANEARFAAKLLAGEMPHDIEEAFAGVGASLFPTHLRELHTECSCPDWANPCKHVAATYYLIGEEFDRDPFLLFTLRGATKDEVLSEVAPAASAPATRGGPAAVARADVPLPIRLDAFWGAADAGVATQQSLEPGSGLGGAEAGARAMSAFPFWRGTESLEAVLARVDEAAVASAQASLADTVDQR